MHPAKGVVISALFGLMANLAMAAEAPSPPTGLSVDGSGGPQAPCVGASCTCRKNVVLMGYWPPTNEMLRPWSQNPAQNPDGWIGGNWGGYNFDLYAFFPEFPPDGNPANDPIGSAGSVGSPDSDLQVDFQDTSADFWRIVNEYQPSILITTSRGGATGWEIEAVEGGHGSAGNSDPALDWRSDDHGTDTHPTQTTVDPRSWSAISIYRQGNQLTSQLPMDNIVAATNGLTGESVRIDMGTSGNYLSGFLGLHGLYYNHISDHNVAAGHIHVGINVSTADARTLLRTTLQAVLDQHNADTLPCPL